MKTISKRFNTFFVGALTCLFSIVAMTDARAQTCIAPPSGLVSWWPGDGNANDIKSGNNGALQNGATFTQGIVSQAFLLDGVDDFVPIANAQNLELQDSTIDAWMSWQPSFTSGGHRCFQLWRVRGYALGVAGPDTVSGPGGLNPIHDHELFLTRVGFNGVSSQGMAIQDTNWHHVGTKVEAPSSFTLMG